MADALRAGVPAQATGHVIRDSSLGLVAETLQPIIDLQEAIWHRASVGPAIVEMLRLRIARTVNCVFCATLSSLRHRARGWSQRRQGRADRR